MLHLTRPQAAETGMAPAQYSLSLCYRKGSGVPKSEEWADVWFKKVRGKASSKSPVFGGTAGCW